MTQIIPLTKIGFFNPGRLSDEEIEQSFVARVPFFEFVFKKILSEKPGSIPQHHLIIGQRGMGKTSLLIRIAAELRKTPYKNSFIPLSFPEEQYNVDRLSKFWLNCLDALADALDKEHQTEILKGLDAEISNLSKEKALDANAVYQTFEKWISKINRRPILLVDNLNLILSKTNKEEQHQLRAILMSEGAPILLGASATTIEETVDYGAPFYDAFQINYLKKLSFQESLDVLLNLAKITGISDFANHLYSKKGRVEALYQLTGGTPRTLALLFPLIQNGFSDTIQTDLDALLDVVTPLYKARFEELSPQLQIVLDAVALHWDPTNIDQLRQITLLENAQLSPQLKRLVDVGWLQRLNAYEAKGGAYELSERFFNIWYLMRRSSRRQKRELYCLTKFLELLYGDDLHEIAKGRVSQKTENTNHIAFDLALADALKEYDLSEALRTKSYDAIINFSSDNEEILKNFSLPHEYKSQKIKVLFGEMSIQIKERRYQDAECTLKSILNIDKTNKFCWFLLGSLYQEHLNRYSEAEHAYKNAIDLDETDFFSWNNLGNLYQEHLNRFSEAEQAYKKTIKLNAKSAYPWHNIGNLYTQCLGLYPEAEQAYKKAIELDKNYAYPWNGLGHLYQKYLGRYPEAEQAYKKAIELNENDGGAWNNLGNLYKETSRYLEAEHAFKKSIALDENSAYPWNGLGNLYSQHLDRYLEAEFAYEKSIQLDVKDFNPWNGLGNLYHNFLHNYTKAEKAYLKASENAPSNIIPKSNLVFLWRDKMNKMKEAKSLFDTISKSDDLKDSYLLNEALFAYYDKNIGIAESFLKDALQNIGDFIASNTIDDWYRSAAVIIKLGFARSLLNVMSSTGHDIIFRPLYVAIEAIAKKDDLYFNSIAAEVREPAKKIMERILAYMK